MSAQDNIDITRRIYTAMADGDPTAAMALFDDDVVLVEPESLPYGGTYHGLGEVGTAIAQITEFVDLGGLEVSRIPADDDTAVAYVVATWRHHDGRRRKVPMRECYTIRNGKVTEIRVFCWDVAALLEPTTPKPQ